MEGLVAVGLLRTTEGDLFPTPAALRAAEWNSGFDRRCFVAGLGPTTLREVRWKLNGKWNQDLIEEVARRLTAAAPGAKVILFGSRARGDDQPDSDIDLLVIEPGTVEKPRAESARLRRELRGLGVGLDVVVVSARHAEDWGQLDGSLVHDALSEGRILVEA